MTSFRIRLSSILLLVGFIWGHLTFLFITSLHPGGQRFPCTLPSFSRMEEGISHLEIPRNPETASPKQLLLVGVMTSRKYLPTRAQAIYKTWGALLKGSLVFFVGREDIVERDDVGDDVTGSPVTEDLPVQILENVSDSEYPPQKKSFAMLEFMHKEHGGRYEWFMRADDDLFVDVRRMRMLLSSLNSSLPYYVGHPGTGRPEEIGRLGLPEGIPYCMGGTGVVLSSALLTSLADALVTCAQNTVTSHEDSELGRCIYNTSRVACLQSAQVNGRFKQSYDDTSGQWIRRVIHSSQPYVTFHPVKDTRYMYSSAALVDIQRIMELQEKVRQLTLMISCMDIHLSQRESPKLTCTNGTCSQNESILCESEIQRTRSVLFQSFTNISWFLIHQKVFYTLWPHNMKMPASYGGVWLGLTKILRHLSADVKATDRRKTKHIAIGSFYRRVIPTVGIEYVAFMRDTSSNLHPYVIRQSFDELLLVQKR